jgi:glycosyltransferase involved in cell wall biosynthesis
MMIGQIPIIRLRGSLRGGWSTIRWMYSLAGWLRAAAGEFDAILVSGLKHEAYVALGAARRSGVPVALLAVEDDLDWHRSAALGNRIAVRCRESRAIVAPSEVFAEALLRDDFSASAVTVIAPTVTLPPPSTPKWRDDARTALATANYDLVVAGNAQVALAVGRLDSAHRFGDLVRAWRIVTARHREARLWIIGDGPDRDSLYRQIGDLDQRFRVLLPGTFDCLDDLLFASDMLLIPSPFVSPPRVLLEAQAHGLPAIAADCAAVRQYMVHGQNGLLYAPGDVKVLADAVTDLIARPGVAIPYGSAARAAMQSRPGPLDEADACAELIRRLKTN